MKKLIFIFLTITLVVACAKDKSYQDRMKDAIEAKFADSHYKEFIIIPNSGCTGCITNAEDYFKKNIDSINTIFIFTRIFSEKELKLKVGADNLIKDNVYLDRNNNFYFQEYAESIYPIKVYFDKSKDLMKMEVLEM